MIKERLEEKAINADKVIDWAVEGGIKDLVGRNQQLFRGYEDYLKKHVDEKLINSKVSELGKEIKEKKMNPIVAVSFLYNKLKKYIASGSMFNTKGEEFVLGRGLESKVEVSGLFGRMKDFFLYLSKPKEQRYFERTLKNANSIYQAFASNNENVAVVSEMGKYMDEMNALSPFLKIMKERKLIDKYEAKKLYREAAEKTEKKTEGFKQNLEQYLTAKTAALILGIFGFSLIVVSSNITGAVIGIQKEVASGIAGVILMIASLFIFLCSSKKKHK
ncbi:MAG: hypothetical protein AABW47_02140 [Nanoarchaeota archaeon]